MLCADARTQHLDLDSVLGTNEKISNQIISEIEKELQDNTYDMISLVFLLYEIPDTALQRLIVLQRISKEKGYSTNLNLLHDWFQYAKIKPTWKNELIEALLLCQLNSIVKKLGINVSHAKKEYQPHNMNARKFINPLKKSLYKLCENMKSENLLNLKKSLISYNIDTMQYDSCELVLLDLLCKKFIKINQFQNDYTIQMEELIKIVKNLPGLREIAHDFTVLQQSINDESKPGPSTVTNIFSSNKEFTTKPKVDNKYNMDNFNDLFKEMNLSDLEDNDSLKCDKQFKNKTKDIKSNDDNYYPIINPHRVGVCLVISQINFHPSKHSIENGNQNVPLEKRVGSEKDTEQLINTMSSFNFKVISATDIGHIEMFKLIKDVIKNEILPEHSMFMLCILSHGVRGCVYAADSVKVNMDDIQGLLESKDAVCLYDKPKLLIIQACQVKEAPAEEFVADSPEYGYQLKKANFLIYWATAPELEAFRHEEKGSVFIQLLCKVIDEIGRKDHICDICTKVNNIVTNLCRKNKYIQVPLFQSTLMKKLYLQIPK